MKRVYPFLTILYVFALLVAPASAADATLFALKLWLMNVLPSLLPFFIGVELLEKSGAFSFGARRLDGAARLLLKCPGEAFAALLLSYAAGFPAGARIIAGLNNSGALTENQARRLASFGAVSSPGFVLIGVGITMLGSERAGWLMLISHILGAVITGTVFFTGAEEEKIAPRVEFPKQSASNVISAAISKSGMAMIGVATAMVLFTVINSVFFANSGITACIFEMTAGCSFVAGLDIAFGVKTALACAVVSFGGLSIMIQSLQFLGGVMPFGRYVLLKTVYALTSFALCLALSAFL